MPSATLRHKNESFESLYRRFKKQVEKADTMKECRKRECFEKPSLIRKREKAAAKKRAQRAIEQQKQRMMKPSQKPKSAKRTKKRHNRSEQTDK